MVLASCVIVLSYFGLSASNHFEWDDYHWGHHQQEATPAPYQQDQQIPDQYQQQNQGHHHQQNGEYQRVGQSDQFQGYPTSRHTQPTTMIPCCTTALPTTLVTPVPNSVPKDMPKHRILLRQLFRQVLGPNFTSPEVQQLAFLSTAPSSPLNSQVQDFPQPQSAETQYDLPQYIEPPPPPHFSDHFNYYS